MFSVAQKRKISDDLESCKCSNGSCGSELFEKAHRIKTVSALHPKNPTQKDIFADFPVNVCRVCGTEFKAE